MGRGPSRLSQEMVADLARTTHFDKREIGKWYVGWIEEAPIGYMTRGDFVRLFSQFFPFGDVVAFSNLFFAFVDEDKDGRIAFAEYLRSMSILMRGSLSERIDWAFEFLDQDHDGRLSLSDLQLVVDAVYALLARAVQFPAGEETPEGRIKTMLEKMDADKDGFLGYEEFCVGIQADPVLIRALLLYDGQFIG